MALAPYSTEAVALGHLDAGDVVGGDLVEVELAVVGLVVRHAVDEDQDLGLVEAVDRHVGLVLAAGRDADAGRRGQRLGDRVGVLGLDLLGGHRGGAGDLDRRRVGRHHDLPME